jgi:thymidylate synthase (FAD)
MMEQFHEKLSGSYEILDGYGHDGNILFKAGTTCYNSEEKTTKTPEDFIKMFRKLKHMSMTEFMWVTVVFKDQNHLVWNGVFSKENFLVSNRLSDGNTVVSGNARAWLEFMPKFKKHFFHTDETFKKKDILWITYNTVAELLNAANPTMFDFEFEKVEKPLESSLVQSIDQDDGSLYRKHHWVAVKFKDVSRGMIDEFRTHRLMSYAVSSTRYIDNSEVKCVLPRIIKPQTEKIVEETMEYILENYKKLLHMGVRKDIARQILPLGIAQEMVVAGTIEQWRHIFSIRSKENVHWEIKGILKKLQQEDVFK